MTNLHRIHTAHDCDESCYCCAECYMATGESVCKKLCKHNECAYCGEAVELGHVVCTDCRLEDAEAALDEALDAEAIADADALDVVSDWTMPTDDRTVEDDRQELADADLDDEHFTD